MSKSNQPLTGLGGSFFFKWATSHCLRIRRMMLGFKQATPEKPTMPDEKTRILRARLIMEEALEFCQAAGVGVYISPGYDSLSMAAVFFDIDGDITPNFVEMVDACADLSVVTIGTFVALGVPDNPVLECVDENNQLKVETGTTDSFGKFQKHPDHEPPDIAGLLVKLYGAAPALVGLAPDSAAI